MYDDDNQNYYRSRNRSMSGGDTFFAFMMGLVAGGVMALMTSQSNREKVKNTLLDVKQKGNKMLADTTRKAEEATDQMAQKAKDVADSAHEAVTKVADTTQKMAQEENQRMQEARRNGPGRPPRG